MSNLIKRFKEDLQLAGYAKRSIQSYTSAVLRLQRFYNKPLHDITEEQLRQYWLCCQNEFGWSAATLRISYSGIQHFFTRTIVRSWNVFNDIKWKREQTLPTILKRLKFKKHIHPHVFRHAYATHLLEANIPIRHVQKILGHKKTIRDIITCKKGSFGTMVYECNDCRNLHFIHCCCGNRHCPNCQQNKADQWLHQQMKKLLPTHYFLLTITLPEGLREVVRSHQKQSYGALFSCINEALKKLAQDTRFIGSDRIGYLAALHTWGGMLQYHPHLHLIIPGGALSDNNDQWLSSRQDLFVHTKPLEIIFKAKFKGAIQKIGLLHKIDPAVWKQQWVIDSQAVGQGHNSLRYLSRYVFRVAISNNRIKSIENGVINFLYKDRKKKKWKVMALDAMEFIRRFLQHVLPKGFMKIRHYGFLNPNCALSIEKIRELISFIHDIIELFSQIPEPELPGIKCSHCGHELKFIFFAKPDARARPG